MLFFITKSSAQMDSFALMKTKWNVEVWGESISKYSYELNILKGSKYYCEFVDNQWENYEDSAWEIIVEHTEKIIYLNLKQDILGATSSGYISVNNEVFDYMEEEIISTNTTKKQEGYEVKTKAGCTYSFSVSGGANGTSSDGESTTEYCLIESIPAPDTYLSQFIQSKKDSDVVLNTRFNGYQIVKNF